MYLDHGELCTGLSCRATKGAAIGHAFRTHLSELFMTDEASPPSSVGVGTFIALNSIDCCIKNRHMILILFNGFHLY